MTQQVLEISRRFDAIFTRRAQESRYVRRQGAHEIRSIELIGGIRLERAMSEDRARWYEVVFPEGDRTRVQVGMPLSPGDVQTLGYVLSENGG